MYVYRVSRDNVIAFEKVAREGSARSWRTFPYDDDDDENATISPRADAFIASHAALLPPPPRYRVSFPTLGDAIAPPPSISAVVIIFTVY